MSLSSGKHGERLEEIRAAAGYEFNPGTISLSAAWELIAMVDALLSALEAAEAELKAAQRVIDEYATALADRGLL